MKQKRSVAGHIFALLTVFVWGVTYLASDYLLEYYTDLQLLSMRFLLAWIMLWLIRPKRMSAIRRVISGRSMLLPLKPPSMYNR